MAEYLLVRSGKNKYYPTIVFARLNPYSKEDLDSVDEIKASTKCISGDKVKYKITPFIK